MCVNKNETIEYYENNAKEYFEKSVAVDMSEMCDRFLKYVPDGGAILDVGCGSGRDLKYFKDKGYAADGLEASAELQKLAEKYSGCKVYLENIQVFHPTKKYDALWACASLLHLTRRELLSFFAGIDTILNPGGIVCISMKSGIQTGKDELGRYFENFNKDTLKEILNINDRLEVICHWHSADNMKRSEVTWFNVIFKYKPAGCETLGVGSADNTV